MIDAGAAALVIILACAGLIAGQLVVIRLAPRYPKYWHLVVGLIGGWAAGGGLACLIIWLSWR